MACRKTFGRKLAALDQFARSKEEVRLLKSE
jgi:hypothetical protein